MDERMPVDDWCQLVDRGSRRLVMKEVGQVDEAIAVEFRPAIVDEPLPVGPARPLNAVACQVDDVFHGLGLGALPRLRSYGLATVQAID